MESKDFEELGWKPIDGGLGIGLDHWDIGGKWSLYWFDEAKDIISIDYGTFPKQTQYFRGTIKSKAELKKLMKQLGI